MRREIILFRAIFLFGFVQSLPIGHDFTPLPLSTSEPVTDKEAAWTPSCQDTDDTQCISSHEAGYRLPIQESDSSSSESVEHTDYFTYRDDGAPPLEEAVDIETLPDHQVQPPVVSYLPQPHLHAGYRKYRIMNPFVFPRVFNSFSRLRPISALPRVHATRILGLTPLDERLEQTRYDVTNAEPEALPSNPRQQRMSRLTEHVESRDGDYVDPYLAQLEADAVMPNILPTMSYVRDAGYPHYGSPYAVYPGRAGGCAQPILFSCSPQVTRGVLARHAAPQHSYRQPEPLAPRMHDDIDDSIQF
ncbi:hypothetical protein JYU34_007738 [Plutella xylostella]|uniref:Uncharacterized protein n=1 Tax=Plutella xylostella TaxID=51655 RepID=A0ABQ7QR44_PLUXY|nr:hypothetical protein JYU34_007738 [Plutella xylostella]